MSTAEQIIAEHRLDDFDGTCFCGEWSYEDEPYDPADPELASMHSAHVVAALTNAGKTIVELPEYDRDFAFSGAEVWPDGYSSVTIRTPIGFVAGKSLNDLAQPEVMRTLALNLLALAAAREAEGGGQP
ncbi:hypothetical protein GS934_10625 [Rhodococcus hoagii]|nr:hypothetical protein [Prescottella equi]NKV10914.1 hypothetical protein [Prescottella equi]NKW25640.1 hypothetical protein [Prescottella equi]NKZ74643.1 hypothetical protein [Prescottella equi]NKZ87687.1 hypothetical protein [Prescottella equi]